MKIIENLNISTADFWYDLTDGGYLDPHNILEYDFEINKVMNAIKILKDFENSCEEQIEGFIQ